MQKFISAQEMVFIASSDARGECDCSFRAGPKGFVHVLDERTIAFPEYRGNGVHSSAGNMLENPHLAMLFVDFFFTTIGLHANGKVKMFVPAELPPCYRLPASYRTEIEAALGRGPELWIVVEVEEAYIHCSKHIPLLAKHSKRVDWGTDDIRKKGGDYFQAKSCVRPWSHVVANMTGLE
jgi:predicted pyridoxine 5'-phosphate oxidase superfamily flavin-nucleotide-binding protein